jgi:hypothetical protein
MKINIYSKKSYKPETIEREKRVERLENKSNTLISDLFSSLTAILESISSEHGHYSNALFNKDASIEAYWKRCGFKDEKSRGSLPPDLDILRFQFRDTVSYQIKCDMPLDSIYRLNDSACKEENSPVELYNYSPKVFKVFTDHVLPMHVPGS